MMDCQLVLPGLVLLSLALLASICLNVVFYIRRQPSSSRGRTRCCSSTEESISQDPGHYFPNPGHGQLRQQQVNPDCHHEQLENPIYGNIIANRRDSTEGCYEMMTMQPTGDRAKFADPELNYASLDLRLAKLRKKKARQQGHDAPQDPVAARQVTPTNAFLEVNADMEAQLPSRDTGTMVSHSSIYLNSQQIAQEAEDMERERSSGGGSAGWDGVRCCEDGYPEREGRRDRQSYSNGSICTQLSEVEVSQRDEGNQDI